MRIVLVLLLVLLLAIDVQAATIKVGINGYDYTGIQDAIEMASPGDIIYVYNGTYQENVNVDKKLTLIGVGMPVVNAGWTGKGINLDADGITLQGFKVINASGVEIPLAGITIPGAGIYVNSDNNLLINNILSNNSVSGIELFASSNNTLIGNSASNNLYGIKLHHSNNNTIIDNNASYNYLSGISIGDSGDNTIKNNIITYCDVGISLWPSIGSGNSKGLSNSNLIAKNNVDHNKFGIKIVDSFYNIIGNNIISNSTDNGGIIDWNTNASFIKTNLQGVFIYNSHKNDSTPKNGRGISLWNSSDNILYGNRFLNNEDGDTSDNGHNHWDNETLDNYQSNHSYGNSYRDHTGESSISQHPPAGTPYARSPLVAGMNTITVGSSGYDYDSIQEAIDAAKMGDTIKVYGGIYHEKVNVNKTLILVGVGTPVVDGIDNGSAITLSADGITLNGFRITHSSIWRNWSFSHNGWWMNAANADGIKIISNNCTLQDNIIDHNADGILLFNSSDNFISNNYAIYNDDLGFILVNSSNNTLEDNYAGYNLWDSIGLKNSKNNIIKGNIVHDNWGDGISLYDSSDNNILINNTAKNNLVGIELNSGSSANILKFNMMSGNEYNLVCEGDNDLGISNLIEGKKFYVLINKSNMVIDSSSNAGAIYCINCWNITIKDLILANNILGGHGNSGITFENTSNSKIENNRLINNEYGICLFGSSNNIILGNNASNNKAKGIYLIDSQNNVLYKNALLNNSNGDAFDGGNNQWDNGIIGNTYSDFEFVDANNDGICDLPRRIPGGLSVDRYPIPSKRSFSG